MRSRSDVDVAITAALVVVFAVLVTLVTREEKRGSCVMLSRSSRPNERQKQS